MYSTYWIKSCSTSLFILLCCLVFFGSCQYSEPRIKILPKWRLQRVKGSNLRMKCVVNSPTPPIFMKWLFISVDHNDTLVSSRGNNSVSFHINKLNVSDAGAYICVVKLANGNIVKKDAVVFILDKEMPGPCNEHQFLCQTTRLCIAKKFRCNRVNDCADNSDERNCILLQPTYAVTKHPDIEINDAVFMQTAVYSVIGCAIGIILLISVLIIAVFRVRMKRAAVRRAMAPNDSRAPGGAGGGCSGATNAVPPEYDPFLSPSNQQQQPASSPSSQFGNIIVNVNNGVQYVPTANTDFPPYVEPPPPYSTVVAGRECSPPPPYSTIDPSAPPLPPLPAPPLPPSLPPSSSSSSAAAAAAPSSSSSSSAAASSGGLTQPILTLPSSNPPPVPLSNPPERTGPILPPPPRSMSVLTPPILPDPTQTGELPRTLPAQLSSADGHGLPGHIIVKDGKIILTPR